MNGWMINLTTMHTQKNLCISMKFVSVYEREIVKVQVIMYCCATIN